MSQLYANVEPPSLSSYCSSTEMESFSAWLTETHASVQQLVTQIYQDQDCEGCSTAFYPDGLPSTWQPGTEVRTAVMTLWSPPRFDYEGFVEPPCCGQCYLWGNYARVFYWPTPIPEGSPPVSSVVTEGMTL